MTATEDLLEAFVHNVLAVRGTDAGRAFLERLPAIVEECADRWSLAVEPAYPGLSFNWVAPVVTADGARAVLKVRFAEDPEFRSEIEALRLYDGEGAVRLFAALPEMGAMLIEQAMPGTTLLEVDDRVATEAAAIVMRRLWRPLPADHGFPTVARWALAFDRLRERYDGGTGPLPALLVARAEEVFAALLGEAREQVLLHGDLHHTNVLASAREPWLAIDPKGLAGEREYEVGSFLRNPLDLTSRPGAAATLDRRLDTFATMLGFDRERMRLWGMAQAVLSAVWTLEGGRVAAGMLETARILADDVR
ncbi:MAG: phosphotransferase [Dehalococcoidia bacterium]|nr:phosphotransferase [Dehalococcoidia bacterium]